jgi:hypothetical protein
MSFILVDDRGECSVHDYLSAEQIARFVHDGITVLQATVPTDSCATVKVVQFDEDAMPSPIKQGA